MRYVSQANVKKHLYHFATLVLLFFLNSACTLSAQISSLENKSTETEVLPAIKSLHHFSFDDAPSSIVVGTPFQIHISAKDENNITKTDFEGSITFTSNDPGAPVLPSSYTYSQTDQGQKLFSFQLNTVGTYSITVTEASSSITETVFISVTSIPVQKTFLFMNDMGTTKQIMCYNFNNTTGAMLPLSQTAVPNLGGYVTIHPTKNFVYAIANTKVYGFSVNANCTLTPVPNSPFTLAVNSYHEALDFHPSGKFIYVSEDSTSVEGLAIDQTTGEMSFVPGNPFYVGAGTWPMRVSFSPDGTNLYTANQGTNSVSGYSVNLSTGNITALAGSPYTATKGAYYIMTSPDGKNIITADRELGTGWTSFARETDGKLSAPQFFSQGSGFLQSDITSDGKTIFSAAYDTGNIHIVKRDVLTGFLSAASPVSIAAGTNPFGLVVSPLDKFVISTAYTGKQINIFSYNPVAQTLTPATTLVFPPSYTPTGLKIKTFTF
jgi:6-phosphogluconolactonase (cycloisomerase 2 family)